MVRTDDLDDPPAPTEEQTRDPHGDEGDPAWLRGGDGEVCIVDAASGNNEKIKGGISAAEQKGPIR